jgi:hypothetical protein
MGWEQTTVIPIYPEPCPPRSNEGPQQAGAFSSRSLVFTPVGVKLSARAVEFTRLWRGISLRLIRPS